MKKMARTLAIVPARDGSHGLPGKNLLPLGGRALWRIAVDQAVEAGVEAVVVTTNIPEIFDEKGLPLNVFIHRRPDYLCLDHSRVEAAVLDVLNHWRSFDALVLLNCTHPLRVVRDIRDCIDDVTIRGYPSSTLVREDYGYTRLQGWKLHTMNRQDRAPRMVVSGSCYAVRVPAFLEFGKLFVFGNITRGCQRLETGLHLDIDTRLDYMMASIAWREVHDDADAD